MQKKLKLYPSDREALQKIKSWIDNNPTEMYPIEKLCIQSGLNSDKLKKGFKILFGAPVYQYHISIKMNEAKRLLQESYEPVRMIGYHLGYEYVSSFCNEFKKFTGESPGQFRSKVQADLYVSVE